MSQPARYPIACKNCRRLGRKCDRQLPTCQACAKRRQPCEGYSTRWTGVAARGSFAGHSIPALDTSNSTFRDAPRDPKYQGTLQWRDTLTEVGVTRAKYKTRSRNTTQTIGFGKRSDGDTIKLIRNPTAFGDDSNGNGSPQCGQNTAIAAPSSSHEQLQSRDEKISSRESSSGLTIVALEKANHPCQDSIDLPLYPWHLGYHEQLLGTSLEIIPLLEYCKYLQLNLRLLSLHKLNGDEHEVTPMFSLDTTSPENPYLFYILPLAYQTPSLFYALAALASSHYFVRWGLIEYETQCLEYRGKALRLLSKGLDASEPENVSGILATLLMLTHLDVCYTGISKFEVYFQSAKFLIQNKGSDCSPRQFLSEQFIWLDMMGATSSQRDPIFSEKINDGSDLQETLKPQAWGYNHLFACPLYYFDIIARITTLHKSFIRGDTGLQTARATICEYKQTIWPLQDHVALREPVYHLTEAFRCAILIYLHQLFPFSQESQKISTLVDLLIRHICSIPLFTGWSFQSLWPLFQAGLEVKDNKQIAWLRDTLKCITFGVSFRNNEVALGILESVWSKQLDLDYTTILGGNESGDIMLV